MKYCSKCKNSVTENAKFCNICGSETSSSLVTKSKDEQSIKGTTIECLKCGEKIEGKIKTSFLGFSKLTCPKCRHDNLFHLNNSKKALYYALSFFFLVGIYNLLVGLPFGGLSIFGLLSTIALYTHFTLKEPKVLDGTNPTNKSHPDNSIVYGIIIVVVLLLLTKVYKSYISESNDQDTSAEISTYFTSETWKPFNSIEGKFQINFPSYPESETDSQTIEGYSYKSITYSATGSDNDYYSIIYYYYPSLPSNQYDAKGGIEGAINGMVSSDNSNTLISSNYSNFKGNTSADYLVYNKAENLYLRGRIITKLIGSEPVKVYTIIVSQKDKNITPNYTKFLSSFELL